MIAMFGPFSKTVSIVWCFSIVVATVSLYIALLFVMVTKYLSIYHGTFLSEIDEEKYLKIMRVITLAGSILMTSMDFVPWFHTNVEDLADIQLFYLGYTKNDAKLEVSIVLVLATNLITALVIHAKIEFDNIKVDYTNSWTAFTLSCIQNRPSFSEIGYSIKFMRAAIVCSLFLMTIIFVQIFGGAWRTKWNQLIFNIFIGVYVPLLFIFKHPDMKSLLIKTILGFLAKCRNFQSMQLSSFEA